MLWWFNPLNLYQLLALCTPCVYQRVIMISDMEYYKRGNFDY